MGGMTIHYLAFFFFPPGNTTWNKFQLNKGKGRLNVFNNAWKEYNNGAFL